MKDFLNQEIVVDDFVILITPNYRELSLGRIIAITAKLLTIEIQDSTHRPIKQFPHQVVKVDGKVALMQLLKK